VYRGAAGVTDNGDGLVMGKDCTGYLDSKDCTGYQESEASLGQVVSRRPHSFYTDLRARAVGRTAGVENNRIQVMKVERRLKIRSHTRGVQRLQRKKTGWREYVNHC